MPGDKKTGVIILSHGSKLKNANNLVIEIIKKIKKSLRLNIVPAYLRSYKPDLSESTKNLVDKGYKKIIIVPFFLFKGAHVSRDIPKIIKKEINIHPEVKFVYTESLGDDARICNIVIDKIKDAIYSSET